MARAHDEAMHARLQAWGAWRRAGGEACGYPMTNPMHESWSPGRGLGRVPALKVGGVRADTEMDRAVSLLSARASGTLWLVYVQLLPQVDAAQRLGVQAETVAQRVREAQRRLSQILAGVVVTQSANNLGVADTANTAA